MAGSAVLHTSAELANLGQIRRFVRENAEAGGADEATLRKALLAVDEAATNIVLHGYGGKGGSLDVEVDWEGRSLLIRLRDQAPAFDPTRLATPDLDLPLEERPIGGLGVFLIHQNMDEVRYRRTEEGVNELTLVRKCPPASQAGA